MKMFSKEWWNTPPDPNDAFGVHIRRDYQGVRTFFRRLFIDRYYTIEGMPKRCVYCGCTTIYERAKDTVQNHVSEFECECCECCKIVGYWAHGWYDPSFRNNAFKHFDVLSRQ